MEAIFIKSSIHIRVTQNVNVSIYKQIAAQFKENIMDGKIAEGEYLPSLRRLAKELKISVITIIKAYKQLSEEGLIAAIPGKGYIVNSHDCKMVKEQYLRQIEQHLLETIRCGNLVGMSKEEFIKYVELMMC